MSAEPAEVVSLEEARAARAEGLPAVPVHPELAAAYFRQREILERFLKRRTGCAQTAQELLQDVWVRIARMGAEELPANAEAFLQHVAGNLALDWIRRHRFRSTFHAPDADPSAVAEPAPGAEQRLHARRALDGLREAVAELPPKRREAFLLYRGEGLTMKQVARRMGISERTVEHHVAKALVHCRSRLADAGLWP